MRNRYESYIHSNYTPQFIATPLDPNLMNNALNQRQGRYDQLSAAAANISPKLDFIQASPYDSGHVNEALQIGKFYSDAGEEINKKLAEDDLSGANSLLIKTLTNSEMKRGVEGLRSAKAQEEAEIKRIESIKDPGDKALAYEDHYRKRLINNPFEGYMAGKNSAVRQASIGDNPDLEKIIGEITSKIESDGYPTGDGRILRKAISSDGSESFKLYSQDGQVTSEIKPQDAYDIITGAVQNNPKIKDYVNWRNEVGSSIDVNLDNMIRSYANAKAHKRSTLDTKITDDSVGFYDYTHQEENAQGGINTRTPINNPFSFGNSSNEIVDVGNGELPIDMFGEKLGGFAIKNGTVYQLRPDPNYEKNLKNQKGNLVGVTPSRNQWVDVGNYTDDIIDKYVKVTEQTPNGVQVTIQRNDPSIYKQGRAIAKLTPEESIQVYQGMNKSMAQVPYTELAGSSKVTNKKLTLADLNAQGNNSFKIRELGKDGDVNFKNTKISDLDGKLDIRQTGEALYIPGIGAGYARYTAFDKDTNTEYELISNKRDESKIPYYDQVEDYYDFKSDPNIHQEAYDGGGDGDSKYFVVLDKNQILVQNPQKNTYESDSQPQVRMKIVTNAKSKDDAINKIADGTAEYGTYKQGGGAEWNLDEYIYHISNENK